MEPAPGTQTANVALNDVLRQLNAAPNKAARVALLPAFRRVTRFVPAFLRSVSGDTGPLIEEILDHLESVFIINGYKFVGTHGLRSAKALIKRIARNKLLTLLRRTTLQSVYAGAVTANADALFELAHEAGRRVVPEVRATLGHGSSTETNLALLLEMAFLGLTTREQAHRHGLEPEDMDDVEWVRVRNRLDNRRRLGRRVLSSTLHQLVRERRVHRIDARVFAEFCGCAWEEGKRAC